MPLVHDLAACPEVEMTDSEGQVTVFHVQNWRVADADTAMAPGTVDHSVGCRRGSGSLAAEVSASESGLNFLVAAVVMGLCYPRRGAGA